MSVHNVRLSFCRKKTFFRTVSNIFLYCGLFLFCCGSLPAQGKEQRDSGDANDELLEQYIRSKGNETIVFDSSNVKRFWVSSSVAEKDGSIEITLNENNTKKLSSAPLKIQLANARVDQKCSVEVIADDEDVSFTVTNAKSMTLSSSSSGGEFLQYNIQTSAFRLVDIQDLAFNLNFFSNENKTISIKKIIFSFSKDHDFSIDPGVFPVSEADLLTGAASVTKESETAFNVTGKNISLLTKKNIIIDDKEVSLSAKVKNLGDREISVRLGYVPYSVTGKEIHSVNTPYKNISKVLKVISFDANSNKMVVDSYPEWEKGCSVAINAKENLSDLPNYSLLSGKIAEIAKLENDQAEVLFDKPIATPPRTGQAVRIHSSSAGNYYMYALSKKIQPGEEVFLQTTTKKDDNILSFSSTSFFRGIYYVKPLVMLISDENISVQINEFIVSH